MRFKLLRTAILLSLVSVAYTEPATISYQGSLLDPSGQGVPDGVYRAQFTLYDAPGGGTHQWSEVMDVDVRNGLFSADLGLTVPLYDVFVTNPSLWLLVTVDMDRSGSFEADEVFHPLQRMNGAPWSCPRIEPNAESPNMIGGHANNATSEGVIGATIAGGGLEEAPNRILSNYATVGGGIRNQAGEGSPGFGQTVAGGAQNQALGHGSTIGGGRENSTTAEIATVGGGMWNDAEADFSTIPGGQGARAALHGQMAYAAGSFGTAGMAQHSLYVLRKRTTDASLQTLALDGFNGRLTISDGRSLTFNALVVARSDTGQSGGASIMGVIENHGGTTSMIGTPVVLPLGSDDPSWSATVTADDANDSLNFEVRGASGTTIRWVATVRTAEVSW